MSEKIEQLATILIQMDILYQNQTRIKEAVQTTTLNPPLYGTAVILVITEHALEQVFIVRFRSV